MELETIRLRLIERFAAPLPAFYTRRIVFWRDEEREFEDMVDELQLPEVNIVGLSDGNSFELKKLLSFDDLSNNYLVYDTLSYQADYKDDWLLDVRLYSEEFRADLVSLQMEELNIVPSAAMRRTVRLYGKFLQNKERKAKLLKLGRVYSKPQQFHLDVMSVLSGCQACGAEDVIVAVLSVGLEAKDNEALIGIEKFGSIEVFWQMVQTFTGYTNHDDRPLTDFAAHILLTALSHTMQVVLKGLERFVSESSRAYCYQIVHGWQRGEYRHALEDICRTVEGKFLLPGRFDDMDIETLVKSDVFPALDESILKRFFGEVGERLIKPDIILRTVENRRTAAWYDLTRDYFESLYYVANMKLFRLAYPDGFHIVEPKRIWDFYTNHGYKMDGHYRHFHYHFERTLKNPHHLLDDELKKCCDVVEGVYQEWFLKGLTGAWTQAISGDIATLGYVSEIGAQSRFFDVFVAPHVRKGNRVFVVISDALRFEVAAELADSLSQNTKGAVTLESVQSVFPGTTKFGMASLLPGRELTVDSNMDVFVDGLGTASTVAREAVLKNKHPDSVAVTCNDLLKMRKQERRALVTGKEVIYVYHNVIDTVSEKPVTETKVFEACKTAIDELISAVKVIVNELSGSNVLITADHGFLYTYKPLEESEKMSRKALDGEVYEIGRRYALASPDTTAEYLLPVNLERVLGGVSLKGFAPQDTVRMKVPGGQNYVHGGISLQEMVVPVIVYKAMRAGSKGYVEIQNPGIALVAGGRKISNLMFSLDFLQKLPVGEKVRACQYTLHFADVSGASVSDYQFLLADKTSTDNSERVFRVKFTLKPMAYDKTGVYRLVISNDIDIPEEIEFTIDIPFADDFGFEV